MFEQIAEDRPESLIPHIETICIMVDEIVNGHMSLEPWEINTFFGCVVRLLLSCVRACEDKDKYQIYKMVSQIVEGSRMIEKHSIPIWDCLKFGLTEVDPDIRSRAEDAFISFASHCKLLLAKSGHKKSTYKNLIKILEKYCRDGRTGIVNLEEKKCEVLVDALHFFCRELGNDLHREVPTTMRLLLKEFDPSSMDRVNELVIGAIDSVFEVVTTKMEPYLPDLTEKCTTYSMNIATEFIKSFPMEGLARAIGNGKFLWFFFGIALKLFVESGDHKLRAGFYILFDAIGQKEDIDQGAFLAKIMIRLMTSVRIKEWEAGPNSLVEKEQAIKSLKLLATRSGTDFVPYIQSCFDSVYGQLNHTELVIRQASVEALAQFVITFHQMKKTERSQQAAEKIIPDFVRMLKTERSSAMVVSILETLRKLQNEPETIYKVQNKLADGIVDCVNDVMGAKLACQADTDFYDNVNLIEAVFNVFTGLGRVMQPFEFAVYFGSILPALCEKLENAKQTKSEKAESFRGLVYRTIFESLRLVNAYASTSFDKLWPLLLAGMQTGHKLERSNSMLGLGELLLHVKEKAHGKSEQVSQEFSRVLDNEECAEVVDVACGTIARLIMDNSEIIPVEEFLPKLVQKLQDGVICVQREDTFKCFSALLEKNKKVLDTFMSSIEDVALKLLPQDLSKETRVAVESFWKECRKSSADMVE